MESPSDLTYGRVQELRDALASKGMVLKDSILARFAKLKPPLVNPGSCAVAPPSQETQASEMHQPRSHGAEEEEEAKAPASNGASISKPSQRKNLGRPVDTSSSGDDVRVLVVKPASLSAETEGERKRRRSERFGTVDEDEKLRIRAARFSPISGVENLKEDPEKMQARAARFGIVDEEAKKRARLERFGKGLQEESPAEREKMLARIARFSSAEGKALSITKKE